jgi:hypothetical protein
VADLTTVANVKSLAGGTITGSADDARLAVLVTEASAFLVTATKRKFDGVAAFSEIRDGSGGCELFLRYAPDVQSITSLTVDTAAIAAQAVDGQPGYVLIDGRTIFLEGYLFSRGRRNVRVAGTQGFASVPTEVSQACAELVLSAYRRDPRGVDVRSESNEVGKVTESFDLKDCPAFVARVINEYRRVVPL